MMNIDSVHLAFRSNTEGAQTVLNELEAELAEAKARQSRILVDIAKANSASFAGDKQARNALSGLNKQDVGVGRLILSLEREVAEAKKRVEAEDQAETAALKRAQADAAAQDTAKPNFVAGGKIVEDARGVLRGLETRLSDARARHVEAQSKALALAYPAHTGDEGARKKLDGLGPKSAREAEEIAWLEAALIEAQRRVDQAVANECNEVERRKAQEALALLGDFSQRGKLLDESLDKFVRQYDELARDFRALQLLGYGPTSYPLIQVNMQAAAATKLQFTDLRQSFLAPHERRNFISVIEGWARHVRARAEARLNRNVPGKKAA